MGSDETPWITFAVDSIYGSEYDGKVWLRILSGSHRGMIVIIPRGEYHYDQETYESVESLEVGEKVEARLCKRDTPILLWKAKEIREP